MKKLIFTLGLISGLYLTGISQNAEKLLTGKWYAQGIFDGKNISLSKTVPKSSDWEAKFEPNGVMNFCSVLKTGVINSEGNEVKAGAFYCDPQYSYDLKGDMLHIKYGLADWYFKVKEMPNNAGIELGYSNDKTFKASSTK